MEMLGWPLGAIAALSVFLAVKIWIGLRDKIEIASTSDGDVEIASDAEIASRLK